MIEKNISVIRQKMKDAATRSGRDVSEISLMAVSKTFGVDSIREAYKAGCTVFGENHVKEAADKIKECSDLDIEWHFIGHLQKNKIAKAVTVFDSIDSLDDIKTAELVDSKSKNIDKIMNIYIEVNIGGESQKNGINADDVLEFAHRLSFFKNLKIEGVMAIPPISADKTSRPYFRQLRQLCDKCSDAGFNFGLSMGMSNDFDIAIEEGSTIIRVGRAIFGKRDGQ